jgi:Flp pilus assembly protein TadG
MVRFMSEKRKKGQALVEFALTLPLLLLLVFGVLDFGRAFKTKIVLTNAAREGTHYFMYNKEDYKTEFAETINTVIAEAFNSGVEINTTPPGEGTVDVFCFTDKNENGIVDSDENDADCSGEGIKRATIVVTVKIPFKPVMFGWFGDLLDTISGESRMLVP